MIYYKFKMVKTFTTLLRTVYVLPLLVLMGFFACVVHITPQSHHITDSHIEHSTDLALCVDHQGSASLSQRDSNQVLQVAILTPLSMKSLLVLNTDFISSPVVKLYPPPNKTSLYIKNNTFMI